MIFWIFTGEYSNYIINMQIDTMAKNLKKKKERNKKREQKVSNQCKEYCIR